MKYLLLLFIFLFSSSCEYIALYKCEWYLMVDQKNEEILEPGLVPMCLRNFNIGKQKCHIYASVELAEAVNGKPLKAVDIEYGKNRKIDKAPLCELP